MTTFTPDCKPELKLTNELQMSALLFRVTALLGYLNLAGSNMKHRNPLEQPLDGHLLITVHSKLT